MRPPEHPLLLTLGGADSAAVRAQLHALAQLVEAGASLDAVAVRLRESRRPGGAGVRCAIVAADRAQLREGILAAESALGEPGLRLGERVCVGRGEALRIGFLFPGQGAPVRIEAGGIAERLPETAARFAAAALPASPAEVPDELVQLSVIASSLAALDALRALGVKARLALGHSLGELTALYWAGALDAAALLRLARVRGRAMTARAAARGAMATIEADDAALGGLLDGSGVVVACFNSPRQRVVSGEAEAVDAVVRRARERGLRAKRLRVVGAFHSPLMRPAAAAFERCLAGERLAPPGRAVISSVSGQALPRDADLRALLGEQILKPVRFAEAAQSAAGEVDLWIEAGPGKTLTGLIAETTGVPAVPLRVGQRSSAGLAAVAAAAFAAGAPVDAERLRSAPVAEVRG